MAKFINGKVVQLPFGPTSWGIEAEDGQKYEPVNFPEELKQHGLSVRFKQKTAPEFVSVFMWGKPIVLESYEVAGPD